MALARPWLICVLALSCAEVSQPPCVVLLGGDGVGTGFAMVSGCVETPRVAVTFHDAPTCDDDGRRWQVNGRTKSGQSMTLNFDFAPSAGAYCRGGAGTLTLRTDGGVFFRGSSTLMPLD